MNYNSLFPNLLFKTRLLGVLMLSIFALAACNDDDDNGDNPGGDGRTDKALVITSGSQSIEPGRSFTYEAQFVYSDGTTQPANNVEWSVS